LLNVPKNKSPLQHFLMALSEWPAGLIAAEMRADERYRHWIESTQVEL